MRRAGDLVIRPDLFDSPTWITAMFVPVTSPRRAFYLVAPDSDECVTREVVGVLVEHEVLVAGPSPLNSRVRLAYLDGVDVVPLDDGPGLVGVYAAGELPSAEDITQARARWQTSLHSAGVTATQHLQGAA